MTENDRGCVKTCSGYVFGVFLLFPTPQSSNVARSDGPIFLMSLFACVFTQPRPKAVVAALPMAQQAFSVQPLALTAIRPIQAVPASRLIAPEPARREL